MSESGVDRRPRIELSNVAKSFDGRTVVDVETLVLGDHPIEGLIGPNGAGKTTLMRLIMHSTSLNRGEVRLLPEGPTSSPIVLSDLPPSRMAGHGVVKSNQVIMDFEQLTIMDSLLLAVASSEVERPFRIFAESALFETTREDIGWYLDRFGFEDPLGYARSAGEKKLLDIIRCLLLRPRVLLLDEPTAGIPDDVRDQMMEVIAAKAAEGDMAVVVVEHDLEVIWGLCEYVHFMAEGSVVLQGDPQWIREHETVVEKYLGSGHVGG
ncbi:MAG TPA: ATP-binding cassette domain-containing protein [Acidimicrobiia bacterium]|nr:ATP-binding cassette domain-containing protein [Acidimicrobiia bacterium]